MKRLLISALTGLFLAGCASTENGTVQNSSSGTPLYGLDDQPQSSTSGEGSLMPGAYDPRHLSTGQFTGQERTSDVIGQNPTLPREADARQMDRSAGRSLGTGTGSLGQAGVEPVRNTPGSIDSTLNPGGSPSASDIYRTGEASGRAPGVETSQAAQTNNPSPRR